ncbi:MAG: ICEBs1 excisionase [Anaerovorax sp.]|nr:ICEBs1 excisionase [Anaerovorax sp.]
MNTENKIYITASELAESLGVSLGQAYKIIRKLNDELEKDGYITVAGKCPRRYLEKKWYGYGA